MTSISDSPTPRIDEPRVVRHKAYVTPAVVILLVAATLTILNLAAAVYTFRSTSDLMAIENRLDELKAFEDRIAGQLDRMNTGIQARLEMLQSDFRGELGGLRDETSRIATIPPVASQAEEAIRNVLEVEPELTPEQAAEIEQEPVAEAATPRPKRTASTSAAETPPAYERIQSQDGKVYYRKVQ